jgi:hypothetical protein
MVAVDLGVGIAPDTRSLGASWMDSTGLVSRTIDGEEDSEVNVDSSEGVAGSIVGEGGK